MWFISNFYPVSSFIQNSKEPGFNNNSENNCFYSGTQSAALVKSQCSLPYLLEQHDEYLWQNFEVALEVAVQIFLHLPDI